jgi:fatty acid desaturase
MSDDVREGRPEAAATVWDPRGTRDDRPARAAKARRTAVLRAVVAAAVGAAFFYFDRPVLASVVLGVGGLALLVGLLSPLGAHAAIDRSLAKLAHLVGVLLGWLLLAPFYYLVMTPLGLLTKRGKRDPLRRRPDPSATSYWKKRDPLRARDLDRPY